MVRKGVISCIGFYVKAGEDDIKNYKKKPRGGLPDMRASLQFHLKQDK